MLRSGSNFIINARTSGKIGMSVIFVTHDLGVVSQVCDEVLVMYAGKIIERADVKTIFQSPQHPYTNALLNSIPKIGKPTENLPIIPGHVPSLKEMPEGCKFHNRCSKKFDICSVQEPEETKISSNNKVSCWLYSK